MIKNEGKAHRLRELADPRDSKCSRGIQNSRLFNSVCPDASIPQALMKIKDL